MLDFQSCIFIYRYHIKLSGDVEKNSGLKSKPDQASEFSTGTLITSLCRIFPKSNLEMLVIAYTVSILFVFLRISVLTNKLIMKIWIYWTGPIGPILL